MTQSFVRGGRSMGHMAALIFGYSRPKYRRGPGWTVAQVKRMAKKRCNQLRAKGHRK